MKSSYNSLLTRSITCLSNWIFMLDSSSGHLTTKSQICSYWVALLLYMRRNPVSGKWTVLNSQALIKTYHFHFFSILTLVKHKMCIPSPLRIHILRMLYNKVHVNHAVLSNRRMGNYVFFLNKCEISTFKKGTEK